jgi:hypothetical protein
MKHFTDTEFIERGPNHPIELISVGIVSEDGREFYGVSTDFNPKHASQWVKDNVPPTLPVRTVNSEESPRRKLESYAWMAIARLAAEVRTFIGDDPAPEFVGWCSAFDYVVLTQLIGFNKWPAHWPHYFRDVQQTADERGIDIDRLPSATDCVLHTALGDARHIRRIWECLANHDEAVS